MQDFAGKVAVVTGAANGIGLALAERFVREGIKVVLADIDGAGVEAAAARLRATGAEAIGVRTDVADAASVDALAHRTLEAFGAAHLVCNNAGVLGPFGPIWEAPLDDWHRLMGVNFWGVVHGMRSFVPILLREDEDTAMVNIASIAGLGLGRTIYSITKHAVVAVTEALYLQLLAREARLHLSLVCPVFVNTAIVETERAVNRGQPDVMTGWDALAERLQTGTPPSEIAEMVVDAVRTKQFYVIPSDYIEDDFRIWAKDLIERRNPAFRTSANIARR
jgi:NAD(P)-dependent dehydrogenase (short-subunit alcohol dehydrogenase family)